MNDAATANMIKARELKTSLNASLVERTSRAFSPDKARAAASALRGSRNMKGNNAANIKPGMATTMKAERQP